MSAPHVSSFFGRLRWLLGLGMVTLAVFLFWKFGWPSVQQWISIRETVTDELSLLPVVTEGTSKDPDQQPLQSRFATLISQQNCALESYVTEVKAPPSQLVSGETAKSLRMVDVTLNATGNLADLVHLNQAIAKAFPLATVALANIELNHPDSLNPEESARMALTLKLHILAKTPSLK